MDTDKIIFQRYDLAVTFKCNNNCPFCLLEKKHKEIGQRDTEELINKIKLARNQSNEICFCGGEPLIHKDILRLIKCAKKLKFEKIHIQTNGRMLSNQKFCNSIVKAGATNFLVSLQAHEEISGNTLSRAKEAFTQTIKGIKNLKEHSIYLITNTVITNINKNYLSDIVNLSINLGANQIQLAILRIQGAVHDNKEIIPRINDLKKPIEKCIEISKKSNIPILIEGIPYCKLNKKYHDFIAENHMPPTALDIGMKNRKNIPRKIKFDICKSCEYNNSCQGIWEKYPSIFGNQEFKEPCLGYHTHQKD